MKEKNQIYEKPTIEIIKFEASEIKTDGSTNAMPVDDWFDE